MRNGIFIHFSTNRQILSFRAISPKLHFYILFCSFQTVELIDLWNTQFAIVETLSVNLLHDAHKYGKSMSCIDTVTHKVLLYIQYVVDSSVFAITNSVKYFVRWFFFVFSFSVAIELIVQHIRDFLNNRGRGIDPEYFPTASDEAAAGDGGANTSTAHGKKKNDSHSHNMHRPH